MTEQQTQERRELVEFKVKTMLDSLESSLKGGFLGTAAETQRHLIGYLEGLYDMGLGGTNDHREALERISKR